MRFTLMRQREWGEPCAGKLARMVRREVAGNTVRLCAGYPPYFVITGASQELLEHDIKPLVEAFLRERGLELSAEKTRITHITDGFDFLGQTIREYHGIVLVQPSRKNIKTFLAKIREVIHQNAQATAGHLIDILNPKIRGWANYHQYAMSKHTYAKVDYAILNALWRWAKRRHPDKGRRWIKEKYFLSEGTRNWVFFGEQEGPGGKTHRVRLASTAATPLKRRAKVKGEANPYDPQWELYFEQRLGVKMADDLRGRRQLLRLWKEQDGLCPVCNQKITKLTGWHNHHLVWRTYGGTDRAENRVLLHPNCHHQVHSLGLTVVKPRPAKGV